MTQKLCAQNILITFGMKIIYQNNFKQWEEKIQNWHERKKSRFNTISQYCEKISLFNIYIYIYIPYHLIF